MKRLGMVVMVLVLALVAGPPAAGQDSLETRVSELETKVAELSGTPAVAVPAAETETFTIVGAIALGGAANFERFGDDLCYGARGYGDLTAGLPITIFDEDGTVIGATTTGYGFVPQPGVCVVTFVIDGLPRVDFYTVSSRRGDSAYSYDELVEADWLVELTLGDPVFIEDPNYLTPTLVLTTVPTASRATGTPDLAATLAAVPTATMTPARYFTPTPRPTMEGTPTETSPPAASPTATASPALVIASDGRSTRRLELDLPAGTWDATLQLEGGRGGSQVTVAYTSSNRVRAVVIDSTVVSTTTRLTGIVTVDGSEGDVVSISTNQAEWTLTFTPRDSPAPRATATRPATAESDNSSDGGNTASYEVSGSSDVSSAFTLAAGNYSVVVRCTGEALAVFLTVEGAPGSDANVFEIIANGEQSPYSGTGFVRIRERSRVVIVLDTVDGNVDCRLTFDG